jgi:hypothetical protein
MIDFWWKKGGFIELKYSGVVKSFEGIFPGIKAICGPVKRISSPHF